MLQLLHTLPTTHIPYAYCFTAHTAYSTVHAPRHRTHFFASISTKYLHSFTTTPPPTHLVSAYAAHPSVLAPRHCRHILFVSSECLLPRATATIPHTHCVVRTE